jgi:thiol peroxidase
MATTKLNGTPVTTAGELPQVGEKAPGFLLTRTDLSDVTLESFSGKRVVLNIFPSIDTPVCATSVRRFNAMAADMADVVVLCVSRDLPFAHGRFCGAEGIENAIAVSELRDGEFGERYGVRITDGPLKGLMARAVVIIDEGGTVIYKELVPEIKDEPDYARPLEILGAAGGDPLPACTATDAERSRGDGDQGPCDDGTAGP